MDIYRKFIKQTYKTYHKNLKLRQFLISIYKKNLKILNSDPTNHKIYNKLSNNLIQIMQRIQKQQQKNSIMPINSPKRQMQMTFILHPTIQIKDMPLDTQQQRKSYQLFCWIQLYYLLYIGKIYAKDVIGGKKYFQRHLVEFDGILKFNLKQNLIQQGVTLKEQNNVSIPLQIPIRVPVNNQKLSSLF